MTTALSLPLPNEERPPELYGRDRRSLELRRFFALPEERGSAVQHALDVYLYFPVGFQMNAGTFGADDFYRIARTYLRLRASALTLSNLGDLGHPHNPGAVLLRKLPQLLEEDAPDAQGLAALGQMFGAEIADAVSAESKAVIALAERIDATRRAEASDLVAPEQERSLAPLSDAVEAIAEDALIALGALRRARAKAAAYQAVASRSLTDGLAWAEEYASAVVDERLSHVARAVESTSSFRDGSGAVVRMRLSLARASERVNRRRLDQGFGVPWGSSAEYFSYRLGLLKKEIQRALYVDTRKLDRDPFFANSAAMVAAAIAATWATLAQVPLLTGMISPSEYGIFVALAVSAYVLKDRIKEWTKKSLVRRLLPWDADRTILGDALRRVGLGTFGGRVQERVSWVAEHKVPDDVRRMRVAHRTVQGLPAELEKVLHYHRRIRLTRDEPAASGGYGVQELLRLQLDDVIARLDEPLDQTSYFDRERSSFAQCEMPKVYHLNAIVVSTNLVTGHVRRSRARVVVNRSGILRVEPVLREADAPATAPA